MTVPVRITPKAGTYLQAQFVYKKHKTETLGVIQHIRVDWESQVSGQNTGKKDEGNSQWNAKQVDFT